LVSEKKKSLADKWRYGRGNRLGVLISNDSTLEKVKEADWVRGWLWVINLRYGIPGPQKSTNEKLRKALKGINLVWMG